MKKTPKQQAFTMFNDVYRSEINLTNYSDAKACILYTVNVVIESFWVTPASENVYTWWKEVKIEIEKL